VFVDEGSTGLGGVWCEFEVVSGGRQELAAAVMGAGGVRRRGDIGKSIGGVEA
jgi:hypothetical protein